MSESRSSGRRKAQIALSPSRKKKKKETARKVEDKGTRSVPPQSSSIISFFNNVPPAKVVCPVCGQMVPRYGINQHMDELCQGGRAGRGGGGGAARVTTQSLPGAPVSGNCRPYCSEPSHLRTSPSQSSVLKTERRAAQQVSPYFSSQGSVGDVYTEPLEQTVKVVSLGTLSSKLSRRRCIQRGKQIVYKEMDSSPPAVHSVCNSAVALDEGADEICAGSSSQKENELVQRVHQEQNPSEKESEFQSEINEYDKEDLTDVVQVSLPADNSERVLFGARNTRAGSRSKGVVLSPSNSQTHLAAGTSAEPVSSSEVKAQPGAQHFLSSEMEVNCGTQSCFNDSDEQVLPVEVLEDFNYEFYHNLSETVEKVESQNSIGDILNKINEVSSPGHPYYLRNFLMVLQAVLENEDDMRLFDEQDMNVITKFCQLSGICLFLYYHAVFCRENCFIALGEEHCTNRQFSLLNLMEESPFSQEMCPSRSFLQESAKATWQGMVSQQHKRCGWKAVSQ
uniref:Fanconi-associated nuclease n=1 Tax=Pavo cristatus TaxID=9049 RepID=A0A8C9F2C0_PAVCR